MTNAHKRPKIKRPLIKRGVRPEVLSSVAARMEAADTATVDDFLVTPTALSNIRLWIDQPRNVKLILDDVIRGYVLSHDIDYAEKLVELEGIISLAFSIKENGMNNSPIAFGLPGKKVQLIGGQRRTMAMIFSLFHLKSVHSEPGVTTYETSIDNNADISLLDITKILVKVFTRKPDDLALERIGMADNLSEGLSLNDRIEWAIRFTIKKEILNQKLHWTDLTATVGINRSQAFKWVKVIERRDEIPISKALDLVKSGELSFSKLIEVVDADNPTHQLKSLTHKKRPPVDGHKKIALAVKVSDSNLIKLLVYKNIKKEYKKEFESVNWEKSSEVKKAFTRFFEIWELENNEA